MVLLMTCLVPSVIEVSAKKRNKLLLLCCAVQSVRLFLLRMFVSVSGTASSKHGYLLGAIGMGDHFFARLVIISK